MRHNTLGYLHEPQGTGLNLLTPTLPIFGGTNALHSTTRGAALAGDFRKAETSPFPSSSQVPNPSLPFGGTDTLVGDFRKAETIFSLEPFPLRENVQAGHPD